QEREQPGVVVHRKAVAERAGDREAVPRRGRPDSQVAGRRHAGAAPGAGPRDGGDGGHLHRLQRVHDVVAAGFVAKRVLGGPEIAELGDVGPGHERLAPGPGEHHRLDAGIGVDLLAGPDEAVVHAPGHGVARLGPVEGDPEHGPSALDEDLFLSRFYRFAHCAGPLTTPSSTRRSTSPSPYPSSRRMASVSSPKRGPAFRRRVGVRESRMGEPSWRTLPRVGWGASQKKSRASRWWSLKTWP